MVRLGLFPSCFDLPAVEVTFAKSNYILVKVCEREWVSCTVGTFSMKGFAKSELSQLSKDNSLHEMCFGWISGTLQCTD